MDFNWQTTFIWSISAVAVGAFGNWLGYDPVVIGAVSAVGSPVAGIGLLAILEIFK